MSSLSILIVSSEVAPFAKTGGLADVTAALARFLVGQGHDVKVLMPLYRSAREKVADLVPHPRLQDLKLGTGSRVRHISVSTGRLPANAGDASERSSGPSAGSTSGSTSGPSPGSSPGNELPEIYFLRAPELYDREGIYCQDGDEYLRFGLLSEAALVICQYLGWAPDIIHANDWHTALLPLQLKVHCGWDALFEKTKSVLTLHNLGYQGVFELDALEALGLGGEKHLLWRQDVDAGCVNFLRTGLLYADQLTTVSPTYAREIQTSEQGMGLEDLLKERSQSLIGIVNGIDAAEWDPARDDRISASYDASDLAGKSICKKALLERFDLAPATSDVPVFGVVSRLTAQKGFELLPDVLTVLLQREDLRLVVLGSGEERYEQYFSWLRETFPRHVAFFAGYNETLAHQVESGADLFLMPSRYEPCGLNQMYSLRYGTVPVVRRTGGLADTVQEYDPATGKGTGFGFDEFSSHALLDAVRRALFCFKNPVHRARLRANGMSQDTSWAVQGPRYVELYKRLLGGG